MKIAIGLINPEKNSQEKQKIVEMTYKEAEDYVKTLNKKLKNDKFWKVISINV